MVIVYQSKRHFKVVKEPEMAKPQNFPENPRELWDFFFELTQIARPSKNEEKVLAYLEDFAQKNQFEFERDEAGNTLIRCPGRNGLENSEPVLIQNHVDMVTDALPAIKIDFNNDPIQTEVVDGWLKAKGTTLGADNGIGCAAAMAAAVAPGLKCPPLELLFTVDEETGLNGAQALDAKMITAKKMLNLDTEEWGSLYIGCAGGIDYQFGKDASLVGGDGHHYRLTVSGLVGGHSGLDIHEQRGNAIKLIGEWLFDLQESGAHFQISEFRGGRAHNIIPRDAFVTFYTDKSKDELDSMVAAAKKRWSSYLPKEDRALEVSVFEEEGPGKALSEDVSKELVRFINLFPHGAHSYDKPSGGEIVGLSNNLARFLMVKGKVYAQTSVRFFDRNEAVGLESKLKSLAAQFGFSAESESEYPSWKPVTENPALETVKAAYKSVFNKEPIVTAIHAGLECGILKDKIGDIDVVSFGPTIMGAHSPDERVEIESVEKFWRLLVKTLEEI